MRRLVASALLASAVNTAAAMPPGEAGRAVVRAAIAINELRIEDAARELATVPEQYVTDADVLATSAMLALHRGEYAAAATAMEAAARARSSEADWPGLAAIMRSTSTATAGYEMLRSPDGRFVVSYQPGLDGLLAPYALDAMRTADAALTEELGYRHPGPVRLEIYPNAETLALVSSLTVEAIETSGTIALCKWDRLMITSPRALIRGYPWVDTIGHEFVHLVLSRATRDRAPVWMQEGFAKFLERRWRESQPVAQLDPVSRHILVTAAREDQLLAFERLHPSIALLPSQREAALAFAQVATFVERFYRDHGREGLRSVVQLVADGSDARDAFATASQRSFAELEASWYAQLRQLSAGDAPPVMLARRLRHGDHDDTTEIGEESARRFVRLADMLFSRERYRAAAIEYERAHRLLPDHPIVATRLARAALRGGEPEVATAAIRRVLEISPEHAPALAVLSAARQLAGDRSGALAAAREAIWLNPFDPEPQCVLADTSDVAEEQGRARRACQLLR